MGKGTLLWYELRSQRACDPRVNPPLQGCVCPPIAGPQRDWQPCASIVVCRGRNCCTNACLITGIALKAASQGLPEADFIGKLHVQMAERAPQVWAIIASAYAMR